MNAHELFKRAAESGVTLYLDGETLKARGCRHAVEAFSPELRIHKTEIVKLLARARMMAANDPASASRLVTQPVVTSQTPGLSDVAAIDDPKTWHELAVAYHHHHFKCAICIAAGRGAGFGLRCGAGTALWTFYQGRTS